MRGKTKIRITQKQERFVSSPTFHRRNLIFKKSHDGSRKKQQRGEAGTAAAETMAPLLLFL